MTDVGHRLRRAVANLHPGWFALVMASGILSTATQQLGLGWVSPGLLAVAAAAYVVLGGLTVWRLLAFPGRLLADARNPRRAFAFFTIVAGSIVVGVRLAGAGAGWLVPAEALSALGAAVWLLLTYAVPAGIAALEVIARVEIWIALAAWAATLLAMLWSFRGALAGGVARDGNEAGRSIR